VGVPEIDAGCAGFRINLIGTISRAIFEEMVLK
jgi:hypothetical protein